MGYTSIEDLIDKLDTPLKERVGDQKVKGVSNSPANLTRPTGNKHMRM